MELEVVFYFGQYTTTNYQKHWTCNRWRCVETGMDELKFGHKRSAKPVKLMNVTVR